MLIIFYNIPARASSRARAIITVSTFLHAARGESCRAPVVYHIVYVCRVFIILYREERDREKKNFFRLAKCKVDYSRPALMNEIFR